MKIGMIGAGAMGSLVSALLAESGKSVILLGRRQDHVDAVNAKGLMIEDQQGRKRRVRVTATTDPESVRPVDLAIVFVKSPQTRAAAEIAARLTAGVGQVLTLQNGMGNADQIASLIEPMRIIAGTTAHGATFLGPGHIRHAGAGETVIGAWASSASEPSHITQVAQCLRHAGMATRVVTDVQAVLWEKLFVNVGINAISALSGITNGQLLDLPETRHLARAAVEEAVTVARSCKIPVDGDPVEKMFRIAAATASNRCSMGQDVDRRRITEVSAINGFVVNLADRMGISVPVNRTLTTLVETLQAHF
ncbi:2-dehydropantoate 2-reductase [Desulfosarcina sp. OttesenSCG-928-A07]|nr:2-dehydropantoate 2-reductase [Desulfosarcina sp. OttesenSCG-928-A07]